MKKLAKSKLTGRGGAGRGQGRKPDPLKNVQVGAATAQKILKELDQEKQILGLYKLLPPHMKLNTIFRLRDQAYGRPGTQPEPEVEKRAMEIRVNIRRVGA